MQVFSFTADVQRRIEQVKAHAEANKYLISDMQLMQVPGYIARREINPFEVFIQVGWRLCFTIEQQPMAENDFIYVRHLSAQNVQTAQLPHPTYIEMILPAFGFRRELTKCLIFRTEADTVVNIMEPFDEADQVKFDRKYKKSA